jgi:hypothetical protein
VWCLEDDAIGQHPRAVVDAAAVRPASCDTVTVVDRDRRSSRIDRAGDDFVVAENLACSGFGKASCHEAVNVSNRRAPTDRAICTRQYLNDTHEIDGMKF